MISQNSPIQMRKILATKSLTLWQFKAHERKISFRSSRQIGLYQLWFGKCIWQLNLHRQRI